MDLIWCVCLLISVVESLYDDSMLLVSTKQGPVRGKVITTRGGRTVFGFLGIPYAKPPVGKLRFISPQRPASWFGVRNATKDGPPCVQNNLFDYKTRNVTIGSEDCLYLNVYSPEVVRDANLPIMVYIHGGGFYSGSSSSELYGPEYILDFDVILVVINYRLGPLGFLTTEDLHLPGNYGLKDQSAAVAWVYYNIKNFGGNKYSITIFGNDAGAASAHLHVISRTTKYFINGVISQSGSSLCEWAINPPGHSRNAAHIVAKHFGCPTDDSEALLECLRKVPAKDITSVVYTHLEFDLDSTNIFLPVVENISSNAFLVHDPWKRKFPIAWMVGTVSEEGAMKVSSLTRGKDGAERVDKLNDLNRILPKSLLLNKHVNNSSILAKKVRKFYFGKNKISKQNLQQLINMYSDSWFTYCIAEATKRHTKTVFKYYISYKGEKSMSSLYGNDKDDLGVCHTDELIYLFPLHSIFPNRTDTKEDIDFSYSLLELWTNFVHFKNPTPTRNIRNKFSYWLPITVSHNHYFNMSNQKFVLEGLILKERVEFWESLPFRNKTYPTK